MHGVLNLNKPSGPTSHDIVATVRRIIGEKRVGHTGTLDPLATGVLVVCVGKATRIVEYLTAQDKEYEAVMVLGRTTSTQDSAGEETSSTDASHITRELVEEVLPRFTGRIMQTPPMVSAVKHEGKRLYELARKSIEVHREPRELTIYELEITSFSSGENPAVGLRVACSSGTYIRTICNDIGEALGVGGYMRSLVRTRAGRFELADSVGLEGLDRSVSEGRLDGLILSMDEALSHFPSVTADPIQSGIVAHGGAIASELSVPDGTLVRVKDETDALIAIGKAHPIVGGAVITPEKVFAEAGS
jgi:tRNA pseudouridine55 synthase